MARKAKKPEIVLELGQLWRTKQGYIQIVQLGKTLAHYRRSTTAHQKGVPVLLVSMKAMMGMLEQSEAKLVKNAP